MATYQSSDKLGRDGILIMFCRLPPDRRVTASSKRLHWGRSGPLPTTAGKDEMTKHPSIQTLDRTLGVVTLCVAIFAIAVAWYTWVGEKANYLSTITTVTELEAKALDNYFSHLERDLVGLGEELTRQGDRIDLSHAYTLVKRFKEVHAELFNVTLISPTGEVLLTAKNPPGTTTATLAKEVSFTTYIAELQQGKDSSIGQPLVSVVNKVVIVPVRHALKDHQGNLSYIVSANLPHEYLRSFWMDAPITSHAAIGMMRDNGYLLSRYPVPAGLGLEQIYGRPRTGALINHLRQERFPEQGYVQGPSSLDGPDFLNAFQRLPTHPVTLFVVLPMSAVRGAWFERVSTTYLAMFLLSLGGFASYRHAKRRQLQWNAEQTRLEDAKHRSEVELRESENRFRAAADSAPVLIWMAGMDKLCNWFNKVWLDFTGRSMEQELGNGWAEGVHPEDFQRCLDTYVAAFDARQEFSMEYRLRRHDGEFRWVLDHGVLRIDSEGTFLGYIGTCTDITERHRNEQEIKQLAFNDTLTALPNRRLMVDRLTQAMTANKRRERHGAVIFLDLDNFKALNDTHGHAVGDSLLIEVADRLKGCVREIDTASRFGGDEFVLLLGDLTADQAYAAELATKMAEKVRASLARPYLLGGGSSMEAVEYQCSASIGVVLFSKEHQDGEALLKWVDAAMYRSKAEGRNRITFMLERRAKQRTQQSADQSTEQGQV